MDRRRAVTVLIVWYVTTLAVELGGGLAFAARAGWLAVPFATGPAGPIRVLVTYDTVEQPINSTAVLHYLRTHCVKDGDTAAYRQWPLSIDATNESDDFKKLLAIKGDAQPWVRIESRSGRIFSGRLPTAIDDQLALFKKWGGE